MTGAIGGEDSVSDQETQDGSPVRGTLLHLRKMLLPTSNVFWDTFQKGIGNMHASYAFGKHIRHCTYD